MVGGCCTYLFMTFVMCLFAGTLLVAIHHTMGGELLAKTASNELVDARELGGRNTNKYDGVHIKMGNVNTEDQWNVQTAEEDLQVSKPRICNLKAPGSAGPRAAQCSLDLTRISVSADPNTGRWPRGFSWTLLQDTGDSADLGKSLLATVSGQGQDHSQGSGGERRCETFVTELCLDGNYVLYVNNESSDSAEVGGQVPELRICDKVLKAGEAFDFTTTDNFCYRESLEQRNSGSRETENVALHVRDGALSMSFSHSLSLSAVAPKVDMKEADGSSRGRESLPEESKLIRQRQTAGHTHSRNDPTQLKHLIQRL